MVSRHTRVLALVVGCLVLASRVFAQASSANDPAHAMTEAELTAFGRTCDATSQQIEAARMLFEAAEAEVKQSEGDRVRLSDQ